ncbi:MAG: YggS family pyridoxal phosphate-dependent enzyme [Candidatus Cloacimonetes bacterium]|nr:YggS family pyridoxal phosphate-dependent enzyme [Candidatus Cloacimonadota bacterium]
MQSIKRSIGKLETELEALLQSLGRHRSDVTLVAVTKTHDVDAIEEAFQCGIKHFGENKVQEAMRKVPMLSQGEHRFHFIGHLQSNKINQLLTLNPYLIHSIDSVHLAEKLNRALGNKNLRQDILIQVNVERGRAKKRSSPSITPGSTIWKIAAMSNLNVKGLMTIGETAPES